MCREYTLSFEQKEAMNPDKRLKQLKLLILIFVIGSVLLMGFALLLISIPQQRWILLGLYTWSGSLFVIYKTFQLIKETKKNGTIKKQ